MTACAEKPAQPAFDAQAALDVEAEEIIAACEGDARAAVRTLVQFAHFQETQLAEMRAAVSHGFARGRFLLANG